MDNPAISKLKEYLQELNQKIKFVDIEEQANHIGLINKIDTSIKQLQLCEKYGIVGGSKVYKLPSTGNVNWDIFSVAWTCESHRAENWEEVLFDGETVKLVDGDLVIQV